MALNPELVAEAHALRDRLIEEHGVAEDSGDRYRAGGTAGFYWDLSELLVFGLSHNGTMVEKRGPDGLPQSVFIIEDDDLRAAMGNASSYLGRPVEEH